METLPVEILEDISKYLDLKERFKFAVQFRLLHVRDNCILDLPSACYISALKTGRMELLQWWYERCTDVKFKFTKGDLRFAVRNGHLSVLQWWLEKNLEVDWYSLNWCATNDGHLHILQWCKENHHLRPHLYHLDYASKNGHVDVLQWLKDNFDGVNLFYTRDAIDFASAKGHVQVLQWWNDSGLPLEWSKNAMNLASKNGHLRILQWWWDNFSDDLKFNHKAMEFASANGHVDVLQWWKCHGCRFKAKALKVASPAAAKWWLDSGFITNEKSVRRLQRIQLAIN